MNEFREIFFDFRLVRRTRRRRRIAEQFFDLLIIIRTVRWKRTRRVLRLPTGHRFL
jgi:hypothetical protein